MVTSPFLSFSTNLYKISLCFLFLKHVEVHCHGFCAVLIIGTDGQSGISSILAEEFIVDSFTLEVSSVYSPMGPNVQTGHVVVRACLLSA